MTVPFRYFTLLLLFLSVMTPLSADWSQEEFNSIFKNDKSFKPEFVTRPAKEVHPAYQIASYAIDMSARLPPTYIHYNKNAQEWQELAYQILTYGRFFGGISKTRTANFAERSVGRNVAGSLRSFFTRESLTRDMDVVAQWLPQEYQSHLQAVATFLGLEGKGINFGNNPLNVYSGPQVRGGRLYNAILDTIPQGAQFDQRGIPYYFDQGSNSWLPVGIRPFNDGVTSDHDAFIERVLFPTHDIDFEVLTWNIWDPRTRGGWGHGADQAHPRETIDAAVDRLHRVAFEVGQFVNRFKNLAVINLEEFPMDSELEDLDPEAKHVESMKNEALRNVLEYVHQVSAVGVKWNYQLQRTGNKNFGLLTLYREDVFPGQDDETLRITSLTSVYEQIVRARYEIPTNQVGRFLPLILTMNNGRKILLGNIHFASNSNKGPEKTQELRNFLYYALLSSIQGVDLALWSGDYNMPFKPLNQDFAGTRKVIYGFPFSSLVWKKGVPTLNSTDGFAAQFNAQVADPLQLPAVRDIQWLAPLISEEMATLKDYIHVLYNLGRLTQQDIEHFLNNYKAPLESQIAALNLIAHFGRDYAWPVIASVSLERGLNITKHSDYLTTYWALCVAYDRSTGLRVLDLIDNGQLTWDDVVGFNQTGVNVAAELENVESKQPQARQVPHPSSTPTRGMPPALFTYVKQLPQKQRGQITLLYNNYQITAKTLQTYVTGVVRDREGKITLSPQRVQELQGLVDRLNHLPLRTPAVDVQQEDDAPPAYKAPAALSPAFNAALGTVAHPSQKEHVKQILKQEYVSEATLIEMLQEAQRITREKPQHNEKPSLSPALRDLFRLIEQKVITESSQVKALTLIPFDQQPELLGYMVNFTSKGINPDGIWAVVYGLPDDANKEQRRQRIQALLHTLSSGY